MSASKTLEEWFSALKKDAAAKTDQQQGSQSIKNLKAVAQDRRDEARVAGGWRR